MQYKNLFKSILSTKKIISNYLNALTQVFYNIVNNSNKIPVGYYCLCYDRYFTLSQTILYCYCYKFAYNNFQCTMYTHLYVTFC